jgi:peptidoglycan/LPS O-acetylase OafA/YrhL
VALLPIQSLRRAAWYGIGLSVVLRVLAPHVFPAGNDRWLFMNLDGFMAGGLVAIAAARKDATACSWEKLWSLRWPLLILALVLTRLHASAFRSYVEVIQPLAAAAAAGVWIAGVIRGPQGIESRLLNSRPLVALGLISYSLYLWQQVWLSPSIQWSNAQSPWPAVFPQNLIVCLVCGTLSYVLIERPCVRLKDWLLHRRPIMTATELPNARADIH